jgi:predicted acylesterase/phospholipase RssA
MFKHIVISGGGPSGFTAYGVLKQLALQNKWNINTLQTIHGTSVGSLIASLVLLKYEWEWLDDYLIKRPWEKFLNKYFNFNFNFTSNPLQASSSLSSYDNDNTLPALDTIIEFLSNKGMDSRIFIAYILEPLFLAKELDIYTITLQSFYEYSNVALFMYTTELNQSNRLTPTIFSHYTHPEMKLLDCISTSISIPFIFKPICIDDKCYIDGGLLNNFPLSLALEQIYTTHKNSINHTNDIKEDEKKEIEEQIKREIIGIKNVYPDKMNTITEDTSLFEFIYIFLRKIHFTLDINSSIHPEIPHMILCNPLHTNHTQTNDNNNYHTNQITSTHEMNDWMNSLYSQEYRDKLIQHGISIATTFITSMHHDSV